MPDDSSDSSFASVCWLNGDKRGQPDWLITASAPFRHLAMHRSKIHASVKVGLAIITSSSHYLTSRKRLGSRVYRFVTFCSSYVTIFASGNGGEKADSMTAVTLCSIARKGGENKTKLSQWRHRCGRGKAKIAPQTLYPPPL